ncbi:hypothetical protein EYF80_041062 [Liparis tanakae]|uniref:Uncharacterized protein n=1 Tax=Liparis tanakae TaxID=230148 RepID=A0A4Z2G5D0_9TELE|nr:hypothetical protein EYF80_041062 [Liparis tanakae]
MGSAGRQMKLSGCVERAKGFPSSRTSSNWLELPLNASSRPGSAGTLLSRFSDRLSSSRRGSLAKAPSSISEMRLPGPSTLPMSTKSWCRILLILLKRAYSAGTDDISGVTSSQYTDPLRHTHRRQVGISAEGSAVRAQTTERYYYYYTTLCFLMCFPLAAAEDSIHGSITEVRTKVLKCTIVSGEERGDRRQETGESVQVL